MPQRPTAVLVMVPLLTADMFTAEHMQRLNSLCNVPDPEPLTAFGDDRARRLLSQADILLTGWGCPMIDTYALDQAPGLRAIVHAAGTVKLHLDPTCWDRGLQITAAAAANAIPVAEFTLAAILFANKRVFRLHTHYLARRSFQLWTQLTPGLGNFNKVVGIVGASHIGRRVIEFLRPFELPVQLADPYVGATEAAALWIRHVELDQLLSTSDVVSLHAPALPETRHMLDRRRLALLRDGATLINTARGWLVDAEALEDELKSGRIDAVIDTTEPEILPADSPLYDLPNVFLTPHIAGAMGTETQRMGTLALDEIERFTRGEPFRYSIRKEDLGRIA
jgi:phosphoglycerate dehydrogenase-like enzyme